MSPLISPQARRRTLAMGFALRLLLFTRLLSVASSGSTWEVVHKQTALATGGPASPSIRYGHSCVAHRGSILASHGYYYDSDAGAATWLSDTWALDASAPHAWRPLAPHLPQAAAYDAYSGGRPAAAPSGRFGHSAAVLGGHMYIYGGQDGGFSRHNRQNYEPGYDFGELWRLDLQTRRWQLLEEAPASGQPSPGKRYLAALAPVGHDTLVLYGGMQEGQGDVWAYSARSGSWARLAAEVPVAQGGPGRRVGHGLVPWDDPRGFVLYGGRSIEPGGATTLRGNAWFFDLATRAWRQLANVTEQPPARKYHALMHTHLPLPPGGGGGTERQQQRALRVGIAAGGTLTTPALKCANDAWAFTLDCAARAIAWSRLPDMPSPLYDLKGAAAGGAAFVFGGHLCALNDTSRYPFYYVNEAIKLDLAPHLLLPASAAAAHGCAVMVDGGQQEEGPAAEAGGNAEELLSRSKEL